MFTELKPLLKQRVVMITVSDIGEGLLRVNIIPRKLGDGDSEDNAALTTPLTVTGKARSWTGTLRVNSPRSQNRSRRAGRTWRK